MEGGFKKVAITFAPIGIVSIISIAIFSPWFISIRDELNVYGNTSLWPISIPIGIYFLIHSVRKNNIRYSIIASPFLSPYVLLHSWIGLLLAITPFKKLTIVAVLGLWIMMIIRLVKYYTWIYPIIWLWTFCFRCYFYQFLNWWNFSIFFAEIINGGEKTFRCLQQAYLVYISKGDVSWLISLQQN